MTEAKHVFYMRDKILGNRERNLPPKYGDKKCLQHGLSSFAFMYRHSMEIIYRMSLHLLE